MKAVREKSLKLRIKGYSFNEINQKLGVPKSTLSGWFSNVVLSQKAQERIRKRVRQGVLHSLIKRNKLQTHLAQKRAKGIQAKASEEISSFSSYDLLLIGAALYWGEGYKKLKVVDGKERTNHVLGFTNTDSAMVRVYIDFLRETLQIPESKIRIGIRLFKHINEKEALRYWSQITQLPRKNFYKTTFTVSKSSLGKRPYNRLPYGTVYITVCDTKQFHRVIGLINGLKKQSLNLK